LPLTLKSLLNQTFSDFEIIVVDNNSKDKTGLIAKKCGARVIKEKKQGVAFARQKGFLEARGEIIATTDADTILPPDWLSKIARAFIKDENLVLYGGPCNLYSGPITAKISAYYLVYPYRFLDKLISGGWNLGGANMAVRKEAFMKIKGFNTKLKSYEDIDLCQRLKNLGKTLMDPSLRVETSGRRFRYGFIYGLSPWMINDIIRIFKIKKDFRPQPDIRKEESLYSKLFSLVPIASFIIILFSLFYLSNPSISEAKKLEVIKEKTNVFIEKIQEKKEKVKNYVADLKELLKKEKKRH